MPSEKGWMDVLLAGGRTALATYARGVTSNPVLLEHIARRMNEMERVGPKWDDLSGPERAVWLQRARSAVDAIHEMVTT